MHRYSILFEEITDPGFPEGWYYAIVPTLSLTTHGKGLEGARAAVMDLLQLWFAEKQANGEGWIPGDTQFRLPHRPPSP
jgi:predicted RNase H-like HicB family nuclease